MKKLIPIFIFYLFSRTATGENLKFLKPADDLLWGIQRVTIVEAAHEKCPGVHLANLIQAGLKSTNYYDMVTDEESRVEDLRIPEKAIESGSRLKVDGIMLVSIDSCEIAPDEEGMEKVLKKIWTGEYERDENGSIIEENIDGVLVQKKKYIEKLVEQRYRIRRAWLSAQFRFIDASLGKPILTKAMVKTYDSGKVTEDAYKAMIAPERIMRNLSIEMADAFLRIILPGTSTVNRTVEPGEGFIDEGRTYAIGDLWKEAIEAWGKAERTFPNNSAVYYNLGLAYEAIGMYVRAEDYYRKAILLNKKKLYLKSLENLQSARELRNKKLQKDSRF